MPGGRMKILWVGPFLLHPTLSGNKIRTLGIVKELHKRHEVHFAAMISGKDREEGLARASEYCSQVHVVPHEAHHRSSIRFVPELIGSLFDPIPLTTRRYVSPQLRADVERLCRSIRFDAIVADFLTSASNVPRIEDAILFQHNTEAVIWERLASHAPTPIHRRYYALQARRMERFEREACRKSKHVIAVSPVDAAHFRDRYQASRVSSVATGVDVDYFAPRETTTSASDIVFTGGMDWLPNMDGVSYFAREILPLILKTRPATTMTVVGRNPLPEILQLAERNPQIRVTGTVPDIRPYVWGSAVSVVPLRVGSGTRLKIYEAMAAGVSVVSTTIGAEGLAYKHGENILIADTPDRFADACLALLTDENRRRTQSAAALAFVRANYSWEAISREFEGILRAA